MSDHDRKKGSTRLDGARSTPAGNIRDEAHEAFTQWLHGEVDKAEFILTPKGERIVDTYNRANNE